MTPSQASIGVVAFVLIVAGFNGLSHWLGLTEPWVAFLWLLCWAGIDEHRPERCLPNLLGALAGILIGWLLLWSPPAFGAAGAVLGVGAALLALGWTFSKGPHGTVVNHTLWVFFTAITVPAIHRTVDFQQVLASLAFGAACFAGLLLGVPILLSSVRASGPKAGAD